MSTSVTIYTNAALRRREVIEASNDATVSFTNLDSTQYFYEIDVLGLVPATDTVYFYMRTSTNNGSSYDSGASDYGWNCESMATPTTGLQNQNNSGTLFIQLSEFLCGSGANEICDFTVGLYDPSQSAYANVDSVGCGIDNGAELVATKAFGKRLAVADVDAIQFYLAAGNISSATFILREYKA